MLVQKSILLILIPLFALNSVLSDNDSKLPMTQYELHEKYGQGNKQSSEIVLEKQIDFIFFFQDGTTFNDGKCCNRMCNGTIMTCYFEFAATVFDSMSGYV